MRLRAILSTAVLFGCSLQSAVIVTPAETQVASTFVYDYTVHNLEPLSIIGLEIRLPQEALAVTAPSGWLANQVPDGSVFLVQWFADFANAPDAEVAAGAFLSGFVIQSGTRFGSVPFNVFDTELNSLSGMTATTSEIPEPGTVASAVLGLAAVSVLRRRTIRLSRS